MMMKGAMKQMMNEETSKQTQIFTYPIIAGVLEEVPIFEERTTLAKYIKNEGGDCLIAAFNSLLIKWTISRNNFFTKLLRIL